MSPRGEHGYEVRIPIRRQIRQGETLPFAQLASFRQIVDMRADFGVIKISESVLHAGKKIPFESPFSARSRH